VVLAALPLLMFLEDSPAIQTTVHEPSLLWRRKASPRGSFTRRGSDVPCLFASALAGRVTFALFRKKKSGTLLVAAHGRPAWTQRLGPTPPRSAAVEAQSLARNVNSSDNNSHLLWCLQTLRTREGALCGGCTRVAEKCFLGYDSRTGVPMTSLGSGRRFPSAFEARAVTTPYRSQRLSARRPCPKKTESLDLVASERVIGATFLRRLDLVPGLVAAVHCGARGSAHSNDWGLLRFERCVTVLQAAGVAPVPGRRTRSLVGGRPRPASGMAAAAPCTPAGVPLPAAARLPAAGRGRRPPVDPLASQPPPHAPG